MYDILFAEVVQKQQAKIPKKDLEKIKVLLLGLQANPRPLKCKKLKGGEREYRIRHRNWRILYSVDDDRRLIVVYGILDRKEAYR